MSINLHPICVQGLEEIASQYDAFIIDQWGVIHDGKSLYPGALETLQRLAELKKPVIILTNSSKTNEFNKQRLEMNFGIKPDLYSEIISSAHVLKDLMIQKPYAPWSNFGEKIFILADGMDISLFEATNLEIVSDVTEANVVILLSIGEKIDMQFHHEWIDLAIQNELYLVCPSADELSVSPNGVFAGMSSITSAYKLKGGRIINVGKPEPLIYELCKKNLPDFKFPRILAIGDQMNSDIVGAKKYGFHAALVATGAVQKSFPEVKTLDELAHETFLTSSPKTLSPNWVLPSLCWK